MGQKHGGVGGGGGTPINFGCVPRRVLSPDPF